MIMQDIHLSIDDVIYSLKGLKGMNPRANLDKVLFINTSCIVSDLLYFTATNSNFLYALNLKTEEVNRLKWIPEKNKGMLFAGLYHYSGGIWMIPWSAEHIYIYDISKNKLSQLTLPKDMKGYTTNSKFRKSIIKDNYLYLLPVKYPGIIKVNTNNISYEVYNDWPKIIKFGKNKKMNFKMMTLYENHLYLFNDEAEESIKVSTLDGKMEVWKAGHNHHFGNIINGKLYTTPVENYQDIKKIDLNNPDKIEYSIQMDTENWIEKVKVYSYWYTERIDNKIYFMPHEAKNLFYLDINIDAVNTIVIDKKGYITQRVNENLSVYNIHKYGNDVIITTYQGNLIVKINDKDIVIKKYFLKEKNTENLESYLEMIKALDIDFDLINWNNENVEIPRAQVGQNIHNYIMKNCVSKP